MAQCFFITGMVTILWYICGYSLVFHSGGKFLGNLDFAFLKGVDSTPNGDYSYWVSQNVFSMYQLMFAIITPALIIGAIAERMKFAAICVFMTLWMFVVYFPQAHMIWGIDGFMNGVFNEHAGIHAIDFAGGTVVHMTSGWSALILCLILGKRIGFGKEPMQPHSMVLCMVGTGILWVGWYGFNAGSAVGADVIAANAWPPLSHHLSGRWQNGSSAANRASSGFARALSPAWWLSRRLAGLSLQKGRWPSASPLDSFPGSSATR